MEIDALVRKTLVEAVSLHDTHAHARCRGAGRYVDQCVPIAEQLAWRAPARIDEET